MDDHLRPTRQQVVRLSSVLRAYSRVDESIDYDDIYWKSPEVNLFLAKWDGLGLTMTVLQMAALLITPIIKGGQLSAQPATQAVIITLFLLGCLQLLLLRKHLHTYCRYRHHMTLANRLLRALFSLVPAKLQDYDVMSKWVKPKSQGPGFALGAYCLFSAMAQLQASCIFHLPTAVNLLVQPIGSLVVLSWVWKAPAAMHKLPGMQQLTHSVCSTFRGTFELALYVMVDLGPMPGVPAAGLNAFGLSDRCDSSLVYAQLLVYGNIMVSYIIPVYACYALELHHKLSFWRSRDVKVEADRSVLLPFPENSMLSHLVVGLVSPLLVWFVAEQIAPYLPGV